MATVTSKIDALLASRARLAHLAGVRMVCELCGYISDSPEPPADHWKPVPDEPCGGGIGDFEPEYLPDLREAGASATEYLVIGKGASS